ncbi:unnamed protein product [Ranitomeya imitator]|uniref:Dynein heavy chain region D6 P-loop domain-containing protein n=1 Tax=Ranitomeya imitator TaxID=111125 RepID=A0ABN9MFP5_9NEOB|nr:unnamed protein product [Ranitomeya imitator]
MFTLVTSEDIAESASHTPIQRCQRESQRQNKLLDFLPRPAMSQQGPDRCCLSHWTISLARTLQRHGSLAISSSVTAFNVVFHKAIARAEKSEDVKERVGSLTECITFSAFLYTSQGLFEKDKLTFLSQIAFQILLKSNEIDSLELDLLLRFPVDQVYQSPIDFLSVQSWSAIKMISSLDEFRGLDRDIEGSAKRWKKLVESECPEKERFPQEWKNKTSLQRMVILRALRPDRMTYAIRNFVEEKLGSKYVEGTRPDLAKSYEETSPATPIFFILSPGVNPLKDVESLGNKLGFTIDSGKFHNISLGQGQETVAEDTMEKASEQGHWVILQNVHLVAKWLVTLEKLLEKYSTGSHEDYRIFISAEPAASPEEHIIPQGILENSIKITNEPPMGMLANLHAALYNFDQVIGCQLTFSFAGFKQIQSPKIRLLSKSNCA